MNNGSKYIPHTPRAAEDDNVKIKPSGQQMRRYKRGNEPRKGRNRKGPGRRKQVIQMSTGRTRIITHQCRL